MSSSSEPSPDALVKRGADVLGALTIGAILIMPGEEDMRGKAWWLKPAFVLGIGWLLVRCKSAWGWPVVVVGLRVFLREYRRQKLYEAYRAVALQSSDLGL
jgi:hypothetical protein